MKYRTLFHLIATVLKQANATGVLIGGFAVNYYRVVRQTQDVDFLITRKDFERILPLFKQEGFQLLQSSEVFAQLRPDKPYIMGVDFMFLDPPTMEKIVEGGQQVKIGGQEFLVPGLDHLIALKLHAIKYNRHREYKDLLDIIELVKKNKVKMDGDEFKALCLQYGTRELYDKIKAAGK